MQGFADLIAVGLRSRGHQVQELTAPVLLARLALGHGPLSNNSRLPGSSSLANHSPFANRSSLANYGSLANHSSPPNHGLLASHSSLAKWLGYLDRFVLFPALLWLRALAMPTDSLCVFSDQALGPWIPLFKSRPHIVHCHDLLALEAAMHQQSFHQLGRTGQLFQGWIRHGFRQARCFLSVSQATCAALERQLQRQPLMSAVLYNPLPSHFSPMPQSEVEVAMARDLPALGRQLFLLHIGRAWYKNRLGLLAVWEQLQILQSPVDLVLVGAADPAMREWISQRPELECRIHILDRASDSLLVVLYNQAAALLFPSHAEGFGWPILEALACGCPVVTTDAAPMTEVGGQAASYIPPCPPRLRDQPRWARLAAQQVQAVLQRSPAEKAEAMRQGFSQAHRFQYERWLDQLEAHYQRCLALQARS
jgi:glycosyltransferase involved in cell wall biosynthesis